MSKSGKQSRARRVEAVKAAMRYVMCCEEMPSNLMKDKSGYSRNM